MKLRHFRQQGDTIVEVLIAMAVISLVLGGAYASSRQSFTGNEQSVERLEAAKFTEQQVERLKAKAKSPDAGNPVTGIFHADSKKIFCLDADLVPKDITDNACEEGTNDRYRLQITRGDDNRTFTMHTEWEKAGGGGNDSLEIVYRVYPL